MGQKVTATLVKDGTVGDDPSKAGYADTAIAYYEEVTGHNVPQALWAFMNQSGLIYVGGSYRSDRVIDWLYAMGYPTSEPYWVRCKVAGEDKDVLVQLFERRVLTYTPSNPAGWQVEMGNVGQHYYRWRYQTPPTPTPPTDTPTPRTPTKTPPPSTLPPPSCPPCPTPSPPTPTWTNTPIPEPTTPPPPTQIPPTTVPTKPPPPPPPTNTPVP